MAGSRKPRVRRDGNFDYPQPFHFDQGGKEPVRAIEKLHVRDAFALKCTIRATGIADRFAGEFVAERIWVHLTIHKSTIVLNAGPCR